MNDNRLARWHRLGEAVTAYEALSIPELGSIEALRPVVARATPVAAGASWRANKGAGWARFASRHELWNVAPTRGDEQPLAGEWLTDDPRASILWRGEAAVWRIEHRVATGEPQFSEHEFPALAQRLVVAGHPLPKSLTHESKVDVLLYDVYWGFDQTGSLARLTYRFIDFDKDRLVAPPAKPRRRAEGA